MLQAAGEHFEDAQVDYEGQGVTVVVYLFDCLNNLPRHARLGVAILGVGRPTNLPRGRGYPRSRPL